jgi:hypothetical protein
MNTNFKPVKVYTDQKRIDAILSNQENIVQKVNDFIPELKTLFENDLNDEDIENILFKRTNAIDEKLKSEFEFTKASKQFNLEASGKLKTYEKVIQDIQKIPRLDYTIIEDGLAITKEEYKKEIRSNNTHFTDNQAQNDALYKFNVIIENINSLLEVGLITTLDIRDIEKAFRFIKWENQRFELRSTYLLRIKENFRVMAF